MEKKLPANSDTPALDPSSIYINEVLEEERARISREMHDELGQQLTALKMDLDNIRRKSAAADQSLRLQLGRSMALVDQVIDTVRRISAELRPTILDDLGLLAALDWQCHSFEKSTGIPCLFISRVKREEFRKVVTNAVFRILQEALTNVRRHANATEVRVSVTQEKSGLIMEIVDNGKGLRDHEAIRSLGILGMRERARLTGGELSITGAPNKGTRIMARIPF